MQGDDQHDRGPEAEDRIGDDPHGEPGVAVLSVVWAKQTLGVAFMSGTELNFSQVADTAPDFRMLQACKYTLKPELIVAPANSDNAWMQVLPTSPFVQGGATNDDAMDIDDESAGGTAFEVVGCKGRDFTADAAAKRLSLLQSLADLPDRDLTEREVIMYLEHVVPPAEEQARRAIGGLLAYLQRDATGVPLTVGSLRRYSLVSQLYMAPETFLSLNIFPDDTHPSFHSRAKDGFSLWGVMNKTRSKPGEKMLRSWFARPTQDLATLKERHDMVSFLAQGQSTQLLPQLHAVVARVKDVSKLESSLSRGGLLLAEYNAIIATSSSAVKVKELLDGADVSRELPIVARVHSSVSDELYTTANTVASVIDFNESRKGGRLAPGASKHICVQDGVHPDLDRLRQEYALIEPVLTSVAVAERERLRHHALLPSGDDLYVIYLPQLGFMLKLPMPTLLPSERHGLEERYLAAGLAFQFDVDDEYYFKTDSCQGLDDKYGDISSRMKDLEAQLVRLLEQRVLEWIPHLTEAQSTLAELDCLLSLATTARNLNLSRPTIIDDPSAIRITNGWHPLLSSTTAAAAGGANTHLVPNDCCLGGGSHERLMLLTGPNASGKTAYLRTVAIIVYLSHIGSFVPADSATIGRTDAIHTRMHSKESAAVNQSAFMLDLSQMANIFRHSSPATLVIIDEFGKGTNAQDGISLLYASLSDLLRRGPSCPKTLACTHYTELLDVPGFTEQRGLALWTMQVLLKDATSAAAAEETSGATGAGQAEEGPGRAPEEEEVVFLYKATRGACTDSFGTHCAVAADMPPEVIQRARGISACRLEGRPITRVDADTRAVAAKEASLTSLVDSFLDYDFAGHHSAAAFLRSVDGLLSAYSATVHA